MWAPHTLLHTSPYPNTLSRTSPQAPHSPHTLFHTSPILHHIPLPPPHPNTLPHSSPTFSHFVHIPPYLTQFLKLPYQKFQILYTIHTLPNSLYSPNSFPYSPILALSLIPYQNFSLGSFIAKFSLAIKYTKNYL